MDYLEEHKHQTPNLTKEESKALMELKLEKDRLILTADKGVAMVVLDRKEDTEKAENLLVQPAYRTLDRDPTNKLKAKLITMLRRIKREAGIDEGMYKTMYPTSCTSKFYGLPKIHETSTPSGLLYLAGAQSHMGWLKSLPRYSNY